jgi:hypothetical protein
MFWLEVAKAVGSDSLHVLNFRSHIAFLPDRCQKNLSVIPEHDFLLCIIFMVCL